MCRIHSLKNLPNIYFCAVSEFHLLLFDGNSIAKDLIFMIYLQHDIYQLNDPQIF